MAVGASGILAACAGNPMKKQAEPAAPPATPKITYKPDSRGHRRGADLAHRHRRRQRLVPARDAVERRRQGGGRCDQPRPDVVHHHRTARLRRRVHLGRCRGRPGRQGRTARGHLHHRHARHPGQRPVPARRRPGRRRRRTDHHAVRRVDQRQGHGREGAQGDDHPAGRGQLGLAARRGRRLTRALADPRLLPGGHQGQRRRQAVRRPVRRRRVRCAGHHPGLRDRQAPGGQGRGVEPPDRGDHRRGHDHDPALQLRRSRPASERHAQRRPRRQREVRGLLHVQSGGRLQQCARAVRGADLQQRRVHPRQPVQRRSAGQHATSRTAASTCRRPTPSSTSTPPSTATPSK